MSKPKKNQKLQPVSNVLQNLFGRGKSPLSDGFLRWKIWHQWQDIVGPQIASYSQPVGYSDGYLFVWVKTSAHLQELNYGRDLMRDKINKVIGFHWVKGIKLTVDRRDVPRPEESDPGLREFLAKESPSGDGEPQPDR